MTEPNQFLPNARAPRTTRMLVDELTAAMAANPELAWKPIGLSCDGEIAHKVGGYDECLTTGSIILIATTSKIGGADHAAD
jgi:hypothetical protein